MMLWGLPVRAPGANRRNVRQGGAISPRASGVRTSGVLVSYGVRMAYVRRTSSPDRVSIPYPNPIDTLPPPHRYPIDTLCLPGRRQGLG